MKEHQIRRHELGFFEVVPKPDLGELREYYQRKYYQEENASYAHSYSQDEVDFRSAKIAIKAGVVDKFLMKQQGSILDVGCGEGFVLKYFHEAGWRIAGLDYSKFGCETQNPELVQFVLEGDIYENLSILIEQQERFDVLWMDNVLEHVIDPVLLLQKLRTLLLPHGLLVVSVPNDFSYLQKELLKEAAIPRRFWVKTPDHLSYFTKESLENLAEACGWHVAMTIGDFPIDWFLTNENSNYIKHPDSGKFAHQSRMWLTQTIFQNNTIDDVVSFFRSLASIGMGRNISTFLTSAE